MIIKHSPPRKTPDLYPEELYSDICNDLGIQNEKQKIYFKETIERAAVFLIESKKKNQKRFTDSEEKKELFRLAKSLEKSRSILERVCNRSQMGQFRLFVPVNPNLSDKQQFPTDALKEVFGEYHANPQAISLGLQALEQLALDARENPYYFGKKNKTTIVLQWLWCFSDDWEEMSNVTIAKNRDYDSPSLRVLKKMIAPINEQLGTRDRVSDSMLEQAVIMHRDYKKEHPDTDDDPGNFT